jgi:PHD/YefM family antitoxin component YafN of YafNO toxin-antitoxin module
MEYLTIEEAQEQLPSLSTRLEREPIIITQEGKPAIVALGLEQFEGLIETLEILSDLELMEEFRQGLQQAQKGEIITLEALKDELGLKQ